MDNNPTMLEEIKRHWKMRIIEECGMMHKAIEALRELAKSAQDEQFVRKADDLHTLYCEMANTVTLRLLLNGAIDTLGCEEKEELA
jgi:hypothetical protein